MNELHPVFAMQTHVDDRVFHLGWLMTVPGEVQGNCPQCDARQTWGVAMTGATAGYHCNLEQLCEIYEELSALLYMDDLQLLEVGDNMSVGTVWASYVSDPRTPDDVNAWWVGIAGAAFVVDQEDVVQMAEMAALFIKKVRTGGWESFRRQDDRAQVPDAILRAFED